MEELRGHMKMRVWQNADKLDTVIYKLSKKIPRLQYKLVQQVTRASNSVVANFVEGYYSCSTKEYVRFTKYSKRSLGEVMEHLRGFKRRNYISEKEYHETITLCWQTMYLIDRLLKSLYKKPDPQSISSL